MLVSRHRIGEYLPAAVHPDTDPVAAATCREILDDIGAECVICTDPAEGSYSLVVPVLQSDSLDSPLVLGRWTTSFTGRLCL